MGLLIAVIIMWASAGEAVTGDLNRDGTVDFDDFFLFADNFGKSGPVSDDSNSTTIPLEGTIPNLAYFEIHNTVCRGPNSVLSVESWDSDADYDGYYKRGN